MTPEEQVTARVVHKDNCAGFESPRAEAHNICKSWCYGHMECEPTPDEVLIICGECFHVFADAEELLRLHNEVGLQLYVSEMQQIATPGEVVSTSNFTPETDTDAVYCCPICVHDF